MATSSTGACTNAVQSNMRHGSHSDMTLEELCAKRDTLSQQLYVLTTGVTNQNDSTTAILISSLSQQVKELVEVITNRSLGSSSS